MIRSVAYPTDADWRVQGRCRNLRDPDIMTPHPSDAQSIAEAKRICSGCPVITECLNWSLEHDQRFGIWGGLTPKERNAPSVSAGRLVSYAPIRKCQRCGGNYQSGRVADRSCRPCLAARTVVTPPDALLNARNQLAAMKYRRLSDEEIGKQLGFTADEVTAARRVLGVDSHSTRRRLAMSA